MCIAAGDNAWSLAMNWANEPEPWYRAFLCIPPDKEVHSFDWRVVDGLECVVFDTGGFWRENADALAIALISAGCPLVVVVFGYAGDSRIETYRPATHRDQAA